MMEKRQPDPPAHSDAGSKVTFGFDKKEYDKLT